MKTHFYILLMLGMVFLLGCEDEKLGTDLGVTNVVLPDISEESWAQRLPFRKWLYRLWCTGSFSPFRRNRTAHLHGNQRSTIRSYHGTLPSTATKDSYGLVLVRGSKMRTLGVINSTVGVMPDENLRNALSALFLIYLKEKRYLPVLNMSLSLMAH